MAVISFDLSSTLTFDLPKHYPVCSCPCRYHVDFWIAPLPQVASREPRTVLPSIATTPRSWLPLALTKSCTHSRKQARNCSGLIRANTLPKVACDGMPLGSTRNLSKNARLSLPNCSISTQSSAPQMTAQMAMVMMSSSSCSFVRSTLGSPNALKRSRNCSPATAQVDRG